MEEVDMEDEHLKLRTSEKPGGSVEADRPAGIFVPCDVLRALQGRDLRLRASEKAIEALDFDLQDAIQTRSHDYIEKLRRTGQECRPWEYFVADASTLRRAEILMATWFPEPAVPGPFPANPVPLMPAGTPPFPKLDEAMEAAEAVATSPDASALVDLRRDLAAYRECIRDQNRHLEASDRKRNELERRMAKLENQGATPNLVRRLEAVEGVVARLQAALKALRGMAL